MASPRTEIPIIVLSETIPTSPVSGATAVVKFRATGEEASVYENSGASEAKVAQPLSTNSRGELTGWLPRGAYKVDITLPGKTPYTEYLDVAPGSDGTVDTAWIQDGAVTGAKVAAAIKDAAAGTASLRTLGTGSTQAAAGNDSRFSDERVPTTGSVATTKIVDSAVTEAKLQNSAVTTAKLADGSVTNTKLESGMRNLIIAPQFGTTGAKITRGSASVWVNGSGYSFNQVVGHGLGATPASVVLTPIVANGYLVTFDIHLTETAPAYFTFQVTSAGVPGEVTIGVAWIAMT